MTDAGTVAKKLAEIETYLAQLRREAKLDLIEDDVKEERFVTHTLQLAIQAALDIANHIVADDRLGEATSYGELFALMSKGGWIETELAEKLRGMAGFRDLVVHGYGDVDLAKMRRIVESDLGNLDSSYVNSTARFNLA